MDNLDKQDPKNWTQEERGRIVGAFELLFQMDKKQNPNRYIKTPMHEKGRCDIL